MDMGPGTIELQSTPLLCPKWDVQQLALKMSVLNNDPLPIMNQPLGQLFNKCAQSRAHGNIKAVHTARNVVGPVKSGTNAYVAYLRPKFRCLILFYEDSSPRDLLAVVSKMPAA